MMEIGEHVTFRPSASGAEGVRRNGTKVNVKGTVFGIVRAFNADRTLAVVEYGTGDDATRMLLALPTLEPGWQ